MPVHCFTNCSRKLLSWEQITWAGSFRSALAYTWGKSWERTSRGSSLSRFLTCAAKFWYFWPREASSLICAAIVRIWLSLINQPSNKNALHTHVTSDFMITYGIVECSYAGGETRGIMARIQPSIWHEFYRIQEQGWQGNRQCQKSRKDGV